MDTVVITLRDKTGSALHISAKKGAVLREVLLKSGNTPYRGFFRGVNCHGFGICGSCWVKVLENGEKWPRRSCQIQCFQSMEIELQ